MTLDHTRLYTSFDQGLSPSHLAGTREVDAAIDRPYERNPQGQQRLFLGSIAHEWTNQVEDHAGQVRDQPKYWDHQVAHRLELRMIVVTNQADDATESVQQERAEVRGQRHRQQGVGHTRLPVVTNV